MGALAALGIDADERGSEAVALCPNPDHDDSHPSWSCNLDDGRHHCFACGFGGSFTYLVTRMLGLPTPDATQWVRERKIKDVAEGVAGPRDRAPRPAPGLSEAELWKFTEPPADALAGRGLTAKACQDYDVRWDLERSLWITPVRDPGTGRLWGWQEKNARYFRNRPLDVPKSKSLFGFGMVPDGAPVLLVESPLDVPYVAGLSRPGAQAYPVSGYGVSVSREQVRLLLKRAGRIILALDNDRAGWQGVSKLAYAFGTTPVVVFNYATGIPYRRDRGVAEPDGRDPGNLTADELAWGIEHAIPNWRLRIPWLT